MQTIAYWKRQLFIQFQVPIETKPAIKPTQLNFFGFAFYYATNQFVLPLDVYTCIMLCMLTIMVETPLIQRRQQIRESPSFGFDEYEILMYQE